VLQQVYIVWFFLMWVSLAIVTLRSDLIRLRSHYVLAYILSFIIIGSISALAFSSAGPCYYDWASAGPNVYEPLMDRLNAIDSKLRALTPPRGLNALILQDYLEEAYRSDSIVRGGGISAMPSMHIAVAVLIALASWSYSRWLGVLMACFVVVIWIGSTHLGWHYALDGVVAAVMTLIIWQFAGRVVTRLGLPPEKRPASGPEIENSMIAKAEAGRACGS
jgi:hypothetical protein